MPHRIFPRLCWRDEANEPCFFNLWRPESEYRVYLAWLELSAAPLHAPRSVPNPLFTLSTEFTTVCRRGATRIIDCSERNVEGGEQWKGLSSGEIRLLEERREPLPADKTLLATCTLVVGVCVCDGGGAPAHTDHINVSRRSSSPCFCANGKLDYIKNAALRL